jgi:hypothetical protein
LQIITNFHYAISDRLFDAIVYFLRHAINSKKLHKNNMVHLQLCLPLGTLEALECHTCELSYKFLHDLHHGQATNEQTYIQKMSMFATSGGL